MFWIIVPHQFAVFDLKAVPPKGQVPDDYPVKISGGSIWVGNEAAWGVVTAKGMASTKERRWPWCIFGCLPAFLCTSQQLSYHITSRDPAPTRSGRVRILNVDSAPLPTSEPSFSLRIVVIVVVVVIIIIMRMRVGMWMMPTTSTITPPQAAQCSKP